jgi:TolB-like protein/Flp pilus assembly protein TadD
MPDSPNAVFLSYASQDADAAKRICDALRTAGIEVWFDQSELRGGDAWDRKIRDQIRHCALFMPLISAHSQARLEGYFRREWKFAVERKRDIADELAFLLPVVIDETPERGALVPEGFHEVQWTRLPGGDASPEFIQHVSRLLSGHADLPQPTVMGLQPSPAPVPTRPAAESRSSSPRRMWTLLIAVAIALVLGYIGIDRYVLHKGTHLSGASANAANAEKSIAVLPFVDLSEKHDQEYFADGMAEEVIDLLANIPGLTVIGRTSSFQFKGKNQDLRTIGEALGATYIVEGSVRRSGDRMRVTAQLINAADRSHLWSDTYEEPVGDTFKLQDQIASNLARALQVTIGADSIQARPSFKNAEAYDLYLRGRHAFDRQDKEGLESAAAYFQQVLELDPTSVLAAAWLADAQESSAEYGFVESREGFERARASADRALSLDPRWAHAYLVLSDIHLAYDWDWAAAERDTKQALSLKPRDPEFIANMARIYATLGRWDESTRLFETAIGLDPLSPWLHASFANVWFVTGQLREAEAEARKTVQISPTYASGHSGLGVVLLAEGKFDDALAEMQKELPEWNRDSGLAITYHSMGRRAESDTLLAQLVQKHAQDDASQIAEVYAWRGELDQAFTWLERAYEQKDAGLYMVKQDGTLKNLWSDPRYKAFLRKMNLPE